jgi:hypothetical protein
LRHDGRDEPLDPIRRFGRNAILWVIARVSWNGKGRFFAGLRVGILALTVLISRESVTDFHQF